MKYEEKIELVPIYQKCLLSVDEAVAYTGLGRHALIELSKDQTLSLVIWSGRKR